MPWLNDILDQLAATLPCGYAPNGLPATEPTAVASLALVHANRSDAAVVGLNWLATNQASEGTLGINAAEKTPNWPTNWAIMAWVATGKRDPKLAFAKPIRQAVDWLATMEGQPMHAADDLGHDASLKGWPWVAGTHSWIEPTALALLALRAVGQANHPRAQEAIRLLYDRQLPHGGCNYGNTIVLGQELVPHVQPTGLAMLALAGEPDPKGHIARGLKFLQANLGPETATASLCYGLFALTAHHQRPAQANEWLQSASQRTFAGDNSPYKLALLALAAQAKENMV